jgi:hypothetical protein
MRIVYCFCGQCIEGISDTILFQQYQDHQKHAHPSNQSTDTLIWSVIKANAYEKQDIQYHEQTNTEHLTRAD